MVTIKDRNGMDLTKAEDIKKRWQKYTETLQKKTQITTMVWSLTYSQHPEMQSQVDFKKYHYEQS